MFFFFPRIDGTTITAPDFAAIQKAIGYARTICRISQYGISVKAVVRIKY